MSTEDKKKAERWAAAAAAIPGGQAPAALFYGWGKLLEESGLFAPGHAEVTTTRDGQLIATPIYPDFATFVAGAMTGLDRADLAVTDLGETPEEIEDWIKWTLVAANLGQWAEDDAEIVARETLNEMIRRTGRIPLNAILKTTFAAAMGDGAIDWLDYIVQQVGKGGDYGPILFAHLKRVAPFVGALGPVSVEYVSQQIDPQARKRFDQWQADGSGLSQRNSSSSSSSSVLGLVLGAVTLLAGGAAAAVVAWRVKHNKKPLPSSLRYPLR